MRSLQLKNLRSHVASLTKRQATEIPGAPLNRQPFDMSKMKVDEAARRDMRHKLLRWSLPAAILMFIVALWFLLPTPLTHEAIGNYNRQDYKASRNWLTPLTWTSPQPFVISFNSGTVDTQLGQYDRAQKELTRALSLATPAQRCMVLQNLAISMTDHAARLQQISNYQEATGLEAQVTNIKNSNPKCFKQTPQGGGGGGGGGAQTQSQVVSQAQQSQLQQKNLEGQQSNEPSFQQNTLNLNSPNVKPW